MPLCHVLAQRAVEGSDESQFLDFTLRLGFLLRANEANEDSGLMNEDLEGTDPMLQ